MNKKTILWLELAAIVLGIIGGVAIGISSAAAVTNNCTQDQIQAGTCTLTTSAVGPGFYIGLIIVALAGLAGLIAWVMALVRTISMKTWGWFAVVLILSGLGTLIYAIAGPTNQPAMVAGTAYPPR